MTSSLLRIGHLIFLAIFFTLFTGILGALPLHVFRQITNRTVYLLVCLSLVLLAFIFHWNIFSLFFLFASSIAFIFNEFSKRKWPLFFSSLGASFCSFCLTTAVFVFHFWVLNQNRKTFSLWIKDLKTQIAPFFPDTSHLKSYWNLEISFDVLFSQTPSACLILGLLAVFFTLILEQKFFSFFQIPLPFPKTIHLKKLKNFTNPSFLIWIFLSSLFFGLFESSRIEIRLFFLNILNVCFFLYFVQGFFILSSFFESFKIHLFWRILSFVFLIFKFPLMISSIGLTDFWLNFRERIKKREKDILKSGKEKEP